MHFVADVLIISESEGLKLMLKKVWGLSEGLSSSLFPGQRPWIAKVAVGTEFTVTVFLALIQDPVGASSGIAGGLWGTSGCLVLLLGRGGYRRLWLLLAGSTWSGSLEQDLRADPGQRSWLPAECCYCCQAALKKVLRRCQWKSWLWIQPLDVVRVCSSLCQRRPAASTGQQMCAQLWWWWGAEGLSASTAGISSPLGQMELLRVLQLSSPGADKMRCSMDLADKEELLRAVKLGAWLS